MRKTKYITAQIYSLNNLVISTGDIRLDRNILTVLGFLIKEVDDYIKQKEIDPETKPFITLPRNTVVKIVGKFENYNKVLKYLIEYGIIEWYKSPDSTAKHGATYYSGQGHGKKGIVNGYARKCRLTEKYFKAVKSFNMTIVSVNITNNDKLIHWKMFNLNNYRKQNEPVVYISTQPTRKEEKVKTLSETTMSDDELEELLFNNFNESCPLANIIEKIEPVVIHTNIFMKEEQITIEENSIQKQIEKNRQAIIYYENKYKILTNDYKKLDELDDQRNNQYQKSVIKNEIDRLRKLNNSLKLTTVKS